MGSYTFKWEHPAEEVYVTGTFDNWTKSVKLEKRGGIFEKTVSLEVPSDKIYYKFVVDNNWTTNESSPKEADHEGNVNNFLTSEVIAASTLSTAAINTVAPGSTTAIMAGQQPLEKDKLAGINPLPASETGVNPINLKPGEKVPQELTAGDIHKHVKLDKESYEKSDSLVGIPNPADVSAAGPNTIPESGLPMPQSATINTVGPGATTATLAGQVPVESKVAEPTSGSDDKKKKKNKKKNEKKKQKKAAAAANGNGNANADDDDNDDDQSDEAAQKADHSAATTAATVGGSVAAVAAAVAAGAAVAASKVSEQAAPTFDAAKSAATEAINKNLPDGAKEKLPDQAKQLLGHTAEDVPPEVKESIQAAGKSPEAAANATAVEEKKAVEAELLKEVKPAPAAAASPAKELLTQQETAKGVPAEVKESIQEAGRGPEAAANATAVEEKKAVESELLKEIKPAPAAAAPHQQTAKGVPAEVKESIQEANKSPEAAANATAVAEKKAVESELLKEVKPAPAADVPKAEEKPAETIKAPALAASVPVVAASTVHQAKPAENGAAKVASESIAKPTETKVTVSKPVTLTPAPETAGTKAAETSAPKVAEVPKPAETTPVVSKPVESKAAESSAPKVAEVPKPAETTPVVSKPAETKPSEKPTTTTRSAANGSGSKPTVASAADKSQTASGKADAAAEKKKSRLSAFISKIKGKLSDKN